MASPYWGMAVTWRYVTLSKVYNVNLECLGQEYIVYHGIAAVSRDITHGWISRRREATVENLTGSSHACNSLWHQQELCASSDGVYDQKITIPLESLSEMDMISCVDAFTQTGKAVLPLVLTGIAPAFCVSTHDGVLLGKAVEKLGSQDWRTCTKIKIQCWWVLSVKNPDWSPKVSAHLKIHIWSPLYNVYNKGWNM